MVSFPLFFRGWPRIIRNSIVPTSRSAAIAAVLIAVLYAFILAILKWIPVNDALTLAAAIWGMFLLLERCTPRTRAVALHVATQVLVVSWVIHLWTLGYEGRNAVFGGILPWSDSYDYYNDALRLVHGNLMEYGSKRPIFPTALAALLRLFDGNLRAPLLLFAVVAAWAVALATSEVWKTHGWRAAIVVYALLLLSERQWAGFVQTEAIGLPLGLIGFTLIWRATAGREVDPAKARLLAVIGLFAMTIGLMSRAGPFFILPALALWCACRLLPAEVRWPKRLQFFGIASLAVLAGLAVHQAVLHLTANGATFGDYPAIAYGLLHGQDFTLLAATHPHLATLAGGARAHEAWQIVLADATAHPLLAVGGLANSFADLFMSRAGLFGFVWRNPDDIILENGAVLHAALAQHGIVGPLYLWVGSLGLYSLLNAVAMAILAVAFAIATVVALITLYRRRGDAFATLLHYAIAGVLLSAPFTPPWITSSHQVQTATIAFLAAVPATILLGRTQATRQPISRRLILVPVGFGLALLLAAALLRLAPLRPPMCQPANGHVMRIYPSTIVSVAPARTFNLRERARADLFYSIQFLKRHNQTFTDSVVPFLKDGTIYVAAYDACDNRTKILIDDSRALNLSNREWQNVLARPLAEPNVMHVLAHRHMPTGHR
jgi:hypothetical protein